MKPLERRFPEDTEPGRAGLLLERPPWAVCGRSGRSRLCDGAAPESRRRWSPVGGYQCSGHVSRSLASKHFHSLSRAEHRKRSFGPSEERRLPAIAGRARRSLRELRSARLTTRPEQGRRRRVSAGLRSRNQIIPIRAEGPIDPVGALGDKKTNVG